MQKKVTFTNLQKIYWPEEKITKGNLISYYEKVSPYILPYLKNRPLSLKRNPNGIRDKGFYHKDAGGIAPKWMKTSDFYAPSSKKTIHYLVCNDAPSLLFIANLGCIEMNPWNSTILKPEKPDYLVIDIDPSDKNTFSEVIKVTLIVKEVMDETGIKGFCKTSGASGLHIYIPCKRKFEYEVVREIAKMIVTAVNKRLPDITTLERSLAKRKKHQIYLDYLQNSRGQTIASAYSVRPKPGATISAPLEWKEVNEKLHPSQFTIKNMMRRIEKRGDLFKGVFGPSFEMKSARRFLEKIV